MGEIVYDVPGLEGVSIVWRHRHTENVLLRGREVDVFTFSWQKDIPTPADFWEAVAAYVPTIDPEEMGV